MKTAIQRDEQQSGVSRIAEEVWLSEKEFAARRGLSTRHVRRLKGKLKTREGQKSRKGIIPTEYSSLSLSAEQQMHLLRDRAIGVQRVNATTPAFARSLREPCHIPPAKEPEFQEVEALIAPYRLFRQGCEIRDASGRRLQMRKEVVEWIASSNPHFLGEAYASGKKKGQPRRLSTETVRRYCKTWEDGLLTGLVRKPRSDKGRSFFDVHQIAASYLELKYFGDPAKGVRGLSAQMSWEALQRDWSSLGEKGNCPSRSCAASWLKKRPEPMRVLAKEGKRSYERKCSPSLRRAPVHPMEWWVSDHRQFDVMVRNTIFPELKPDEPFRVWFTAVLDWGSRKIVGWCFAPSPSSRTINSALRVAVLQHAFPKNFYWDNGKDYTAVRRDLEAVTLSEEARAVLVRGGAGVQVTTALPYHPRSKPIEAHFTHWAKRFDVLFPTYLGNRPENRPEMAGLAEALHQKYLKGQRGSSPLPTDAEFILAAMQAIEDYNNKPHRSLQGRTPNQVMEEQRPERHRKGMDPRLLDILFCEKTKRIVQAGGCVQLDNMRYEPTEQSLYALDLRQRQEIMVLRDPYNLAEATAVEPDTMSFIGDLRVQEWVAQCPGGRITRDQIRAAMRKQRSLRKSYGAYFAMLGAIASANGWKSEQEMLVARATGTDGFAAREAAIPCAAIPGATRLPALPELSSRAAFAHASPFTSDHVKEDIDIFREIKLEE